MESSDTKRSSSESFVPASVPDPEPMGQSESEENPAYIDGKEETMPYDGQKEILKALEVLERDSVAIAGSFTSLFSSLRLVLSQVTSTTVDHMNSFSDAAGGLQECEMKKKLKSCSLDFCTRLLDGSLSSHYKSQPDPDNKNATILTVVGKTFDELVLHSPKNILLEVLLDAATKGNRYINSCLRINEEMKGIESLATQLKILRRNVDALDSEVNRLVTFP